MPFLPYEIFQSITDGLFSITIIDFYLMIRKLDGNRWFLFPISCEGKSG